MGKELFLLIDGNSLLYRAFYALPPLRTKKGLFTNAIYGFLTMLLRVSKELSPQYLVVAFDKSRITLRTQEYAEYKAKRQPMPPELRGQLPILKELLEALGLCFIEMDGYEADDIIGSLCRVAEEEDLSCLVLTGDQDALQLVGSNVEVLLTKKGISETERYDRAKVLEKWEVEPHLLPDVKGLMGDPSDNIPGVPGIGRKNAVRLIKEFGSLEELYERIEEVTPPRLRELLSRNKEQAFMSKSLATIVTDLELPFALSDFARSAPQVPRLLELYRELEFTSFLKDLKEEKADFEDAQDGTKIIGQIKQGEELAVFIKADHHHPMWAEVVEVSFYWQKGVYTVPGSDLWKIKELLEDEKISKFLHDAKFAQVLLARKGIRLAGVAGDTLLLSYVLDPSLKGESLDELLFHYRGQTLSKEALAVQGVKEIISFHDYLLGKVEDDLKKLYFEVELPLSRLLGEMELNGIKVEKEALAAISQEMEERLEMTETAIYEMAGCSFNINSTRQLGEVLFERLKLPHVKKTKTGYSTKAEVLEQLYDQHPIIPLIMDYRQLMKLKSTYVDSLQEYIHPTTGRVHTVFKQAVTATGRLSSVEPNLQNIPVRMEEGRRIRKAFVAGQKGWLLLSADYSQIDLRVLAHVSGDQRLIETFHDQVDIHARTASEIFKVPIKDVTPELRRRAKAVNFGIIYGISDYGLARDTGVTRQEAREYIDKYLSTYPGVKRYMEEIIDFGRENGYVSTILGRRRYLPDLLSSNRMVRAYAERMALNTPIQGSSADIIKLAMIAVDHEIKKRQLLTKMLLQVHDELVFEVPGEELNQMAGLVKECMEGAYKLKVPLVASVKVGLNWYDMKSWE